MDKRYKGYGRAGAFPALLAIAAALCLSSCADKISGRAGMLKGAFAWHNQEWDEAALSFLPLSSSPDEVISSFADYGLALSFIGQNELKAAAGRLSSIEDAPYDELRSAVWYEKGVCEYLSGNYGEAALCFRRSLEIDSSRADAKINLELSLLQAESEREKAGALSPLRASAAGRMDAAEESAVYSLIERKEIEQWKKLAETDRESRAPDY